MRFEQKRLHIQSISTLSNKINLPLICNKHFVRIKSVKTELKLCCLLCYGTCMLWYAMMNEDLMICYEISLL